MKVLVTGHTGYIGAVMVPMLLEAKHEVTGLDTDFFAGCDFNGGLVDVPAVRKDIRDVAVADLKGFDAVIHLAALSNDPLSDLNPECTYDINHRASVRLAELAKAAGVPRFLFSSSCSLYGMSPGADYLTEDASFNPVTPYGESKVLVERDVSGLADDNFSPDVSAQRYGLWCFTAPSRRSGGKQSRRIRLHYGRGTDRERRDTMAAPGARGRYLSRLSGSSAKRRESWCIISHSTSAARKRIIKSVMWPHSWRKSSPAAA